MSQHADRSPSGWPIYSRCPGAPAFWKSPACDGLRDQSEEYSDEGTCEHLLFERGLNGHDLAQYLGTEIDVSEPGEDPRPVEVTQEMLDHVRVGVDYVLGRKADLEMWGDRVLLRTETPVDPSELVDDDQAFGHCDAMLVAPDEIEIIDYKRVHSHVIDIGTPVSPHGQTALYLVGAVCAYEGRTDWKMRITVIQPTRDHRDGPVRSVVLTQRDFLGFVETAKAVLADAREPDRPRTPGPVQCEFCPGKAVCPEYAADVADKIGTSPVYTDAAAQELGEPVEGLSPAHLSAIQANAPFIRGFLNAVEKYITRRLEDGTAPPEIAQRWTLEPGKGRRRWKQDDDATLKALQALGWTDPESGKKTRIRKADAMESKVRSPAQIEKEFKRLKQQGVIQDTHLEALAQLWETPESDTKKLVRKHKPTVDDMFGDD
jgi:hypothetical protein